MKRKSRRWRSHGSSSPSQASVQSVTPTESANSPRTPASTTSLQQPGPAPPMTAPPCPLSPALLPPPPNARHLTPAPPLPHLSVPHQTPALPRPPPSARLQTPVPPHLGAPPESPVLPCPTLLGSVPPPVHLTASTVALTRSSRHSPTPGGVQEHPLNKRTPVYYPLIQSQRRGGAIHFLLQRGERLRRRERERSCR